MNQHHLSRSYKWVLLIHHIAPKPTGLRVKVWRKLQKIGALPIKNSIYILPLTKETDEYLQWLRQEIVAFNGDAMIFKTDSIEGIEDQEIIGRFRRESNKMYEKLIGNALKLKNSIEQRRKMKRITIVQRDKCGRQLKRLKQQLHETISLDYFQADNKKRAEKALRVCSNLMENLKASNEKLNSKERNIPVKKYDKNNFQNKTWITRQGIHIDRIASGWLIKRFIDQYAKFKFIAEDDVIKSEIGFDMFNAEFSHRGEDCTFETLVKSFDLKIPALSQIAEIIHDVDLRDDKFGRKEAAGIDQIITALGQKLQDDKKLFEIGMLIFDALYQHLELSMK